jgi:dipeptidyl aminopeptidase/acylaminoacyl peptidase
VINWTSWLLTTDMSVFGARYWFKKMPWEDQETYWRLSPLSLVGNVTTPTMVVVGLNDLRTTVGEAEQYYHALQLRHIPTEFYGIPDEYHALMRPSHLAAQSSAILEWFGRYRASGASN